MIPSYAVRAFLNRSRNDFHSDYLDLTPRELIERARMLPVRPPLWNNLRIEQRQCFLAVAENRRVGLWADTGVGKTLIAVASSRYLRKIKALRRVLILVRNNINMEEWEAEIEKHSPGTSRVLLPESTDEKWEVVLESDTLLTITTYIGLMNMACDLKVNKNKKNKTTPEMVPNYNKVDKLTRIFGGLVMDESTAVAGHDSLAHRICRKMSRRWSMDNMVIALSGTPFGRDPVKLWGQMMIVDQGESLGPTLGLFRGAFYDTKDGFWGGQEHKFIKKKKPVLRRLLRHRSMTIKADESTLPAVSRFVTRVNLRHEAEEYCRIARETIESARGNYQEMRNGFLRMRQISSGFLGYLNDETGAKAKFKFDHSPKLEAVISEVESVVDAHKSMIYYEFIYSGDMISKALRNLKIPFARVDGSTKKTQKQDLRRFKDDDDCRVLILNSSGAYGLNLQVAKYLQLFESPVDPEIRKQIERRIERQGSMHNRVFIRDFVVNGTYDERILDFLKEGKDLFESVMRGEVKF